MSEELFRPRSWDQLRPHRRRHFPMERKLAVALRISEAKLRALEDGRFAALKMKPHQIEVLIRRYCSKSQISPELAVDFYREAVDVPPPQTLWEQVVEWRYQIYMAALVLCSLPVVFLLNAGAGEAAAPATSPDYRAAYGAAGTPAQAALTEPVPDGLSVRFLADCWVVIRQGGETLRDRLYLAGDHLSLPASALGSGPLELWLGDAAGAEVMYFGHLESPPATRGMASPGAYMRLGAP